MEMPHPPGLVCTCSDGGAWHREHIISVRKRRFELLEEYRLLGPNAAEMFIKPTDDLETVQKKQRTKLFIAKCKLAGMDPEEVMRSGRQDDPKATCLKELYRDFLGRWKLHGSRVQHIWRSWDSNQRLRFMKGFLREETHIPLHPQDRIANGGIAYKFVPDLNVHDIVHPGFDYLPRLLEYRATSTLLQQYCEVDYPTIIHSMQKYNLQHPSEKLFKRCFTFFTNSDMYGNTIDMTGIGEKEYKESLAGYAIPLNHKTLIPKSQGELIIERQVFVMEFLNDMIGDILFRGSASVSKKIIPRGPGRAARAAPLSSFSSNDAKPEKPQPLDILAGALGHKDDLQEYVSLCYEEPSLLYHASQAWFYSRPEAVSDERGRRYTASTDKHIGISIFEMFHNSVTAAAIWDYLAHLLQLLVDEPKNKVARSIILQEISNVCHFEYGRVQGMFKRYVQSGSGSKYFKRISNIFDGSTPRVVLKIKPEALTRDNPQMHYVLRLCATDTNPSKAITWIKKLDDLHQRYPDIRDEMLDEELESFGYLAVTAGLIQSLSDCLPLPSTNLKRGQIFVARSKELSKEVDMLKTELDLSNFAIPIHNLLEPGMAEGAVGALDAFMGEKTGTTMKNLYADLVEKCLSEVKAQCQRQKDKIEQYSKDTSLPNPIEHVGKTADLFNKLSIQERREKHKTRPQPLSPNSSQTEAVEAKSVPIETAETATVFKVNKDTFETFTTLFSKTEAHGSVNWVDFEAAMTDLMFSVIPKFGSVFSFLPPSEMGARNSITFHRPHKSKIEGYKLLIFARRLKRIYGWGEHSFTVEASQYWKVPDVDKPHE